MSKNVEKIHGGASSTSRMDSRATLDPNRGDLFLVAMCVKAGDIIIYDFYLFPCKAGVFIKDNLVLLAVLRNPQSKPTCEMQGSEWGDCRK